MELMQRRLRYSGNTYFKLYHLCYYFSRTSSLNEQKIKIHQFKKGNEQAMRHFIIRALQYLEPHKMDDELLVLRALHSYETKAQDLLSPLDRLGDSIATVFGCSYYPGLLQKSRVTQPIKSLNIRQRMAELDNAYQINPNLFDLNERKVLIIDDVVTTGATACAIIKAILTYFPRAKINVLSLAWTPMPNQQLYLERQSNESMLLHEPAIGYGKKIFDWGDEDFMNGETNISLFAE